MTQNHKPKVGLIGIGNWGKNLFRVFNEKKIIAGVATQQSDPSKSITDGSVFHTKNYEELLNNSEIDAIVIATPIATHYMIAKKALETNHHVWVEKPFTDTVAEANELISLAKKGNKTLFIGHVFLHHPVFTELKRIIANNPVRKIHSSWEKMGSFGEDIVQNLVSHEVSISLQLFNETPKSVTVGKSQGVVTDTDIIEGTLHFQNGDHSFSIDRVSEKKRKIVTISLADNTILTWEGNTLSKGIGEEKENIFENTQEPIGCEVDAFLESIATGTNNLTDGNLGRNVVQVVTMIHEAMETPKK